ncbi:DUF2272 domain-containing protein, partial [Variovorax sp. CT11-76]
ARGTARRFVGAGLPGRARVVHVRLGEHELVRAQARLPRVGDLVCQTRGARSALDSFAKIGTVLATRPTGGAALPMHCDVVTAVDARGFDAVGGNVLQSVTLRRLDFAPGTRTLDPSYLPEGCATDAAGCIDRHMSRQPWSLLLQWR